MLRNGSYVYHEMAPTTHRGTISESEMYNGEMRYLFHLDPRFDYVAKFPDVYCYEYELVECERPSDEEIATINKLAKLGS